MMTLPIQKLLRNILRFYDYSWNWKILVKDKDLIQTSIISNYHFIQKYIQSGIKKLLKKILSSHYLYTVNYTTVHVLLKNTSSLIIIDLIH